MSKLSNPTAHEFSALCREVGATVSIEQAQQLLDFNALLLKWTRRYNLVAASTLPHSLSRHVLDALSILPYIKIWQPSSGEERPNIDVLDVGSGAGLPTLPLAIACPDLRFVSVETNGKKVRFQRQAVIELGLNNVEVRHDRIERQALMAVNVTSRAFTAADDFLKIADSLCAPDGRVVLMLGQAAGLSKNLPTPWLLESMHPVQVPDERGDRHVAVCVRRRDEVAVL